MPGKEGFLFFVIGNEVFNHYAKFISQNLLNALKKDYKSVSAGFRITNPKEQLGDQYEY